MSDKDLIKNLDLTPKQAIFLKEWLKTGNATQSALKAYDTDNYKSASDIGSQNLKKLGVGVKEYCEANGISLGELFETNKELLEEGNEVSKDRAIERFERWLGIKKKEQMAAMEFKEGEKEFRVVFKSDK